MKRLIGCALSTLLLVCGCTHKPPDLNPEQSRLYTIHVAATVIERSGNVAGIALDVIDRLAAEGRLDAATAQTVRAAFHDTAVSVRGAVATLKAYTIASGDPVPVVQGALAAVGELAQKLLVIKDEKIRAEVVAIINAAYAVIEAVVPLLKPAPPIAACWYEEVYA
jgi:hypothetical protein